jgi:hypothetical protein
MRGAEVLGATLRIETRLDRNGLDQGRFARAVLADQEGHVRMQLKAGQPRHGSIEKG